ncbi:hypothetical protein GCM10020366_06680 [Saccharopolyspora gregorii]|uniref:AMP-dependent synthetase/ligase domain-containing protein n=1 Tax=Saccharopolyspora gregorii TaxID=33914 RepID=A0ABP6RJG9_9PSEU
MVNDDESPERVEPHTTLSLASVLAEPARLRPAHPAVVEGEQRVTYGELWEQVRAHAAALRARGIEPGDRVAIVAPNVIDSCAPTTRCSPRARSWCRFRCCWSRTRRRICCATPARSSSSGTRASWRSPPNRRAAPASRWSRSARRCRPETPDSLSEAAAAAEPERSFATRAPDDPAVIFYTSGTTGRPEGRGAHPPEPGAQRDVNAFDANDTRREDLVLAACRCSTSSGRPSR